MQGTVLSINEIGRIIDEGLKNDSSNISPPNLITKKSLVAEEILKMFMNQISSLKNLTYFNFLHYINYISFTCFPGARNCLKDLTQLHCSSNIGVESEFLYHLSQMCHKIQSLNITFEHDIQNGLTDLISVQKNLKNLNRFNHGQKIFIKPISSITDLQV